MLLILEDCRADGSSCDRLPVASRSPTTAGSPVDVSLSHGGMNSATLNGSTTTRPASFGSPLEVAATQVLSRSTRGLEATGASALHRHRLRRVQQELVGPRSHSAERLPLGTVSGSARRRRSARLGVMAILRRPATARPPGAGRRGRNRRHLSPPTRAPRRHHRRVLGVNYCSAAWATIPPPLHLGISSTSRWTPGMFGARACTSP